MSKVAVVFWSGSGNTEAMAQAVAEGVQAAGGAAELIQAADFGEASIASYDAFAFGCPAMGAEVLEEMEFQPMWDAVKGALAGKKVVLFGSYGWGDGTWMEDWRADAEGAGVTLAAEPLIVNEAPDDDGIDACKSLGQALN